MKLWKHIFFLLFLIFTLEMIALFSVPDKNLHLIACDVGQGDATLIIYRNTQILVDGGPDGKVLNCLGRYLPFWDKEIELVVLTHPDSDHFIGLIDVFRGYRVDNYLHDMFTVSKQDYKVLENVVGGLHPHIYNSHVGGVARVGLISLDILNSSDQSKAEDGGSGIEKQTIDQSSNEYSIVSLVRFRKFRALLTGDMPQGISDKLNNSWALGSVDYIKIPHHGSKNGLTVNLLKTLMPKLAVISVGKNFYGHPAPEILEMLDNNGIKYLRTDEKGNIEVITDGDKYWVR